MYIYKCLIQSAGPAGWIVSVPALPGVVAIGTTQIKAVEAAAAAIESHLERLIHPARRRG
jgi:predicted RNase H-like HicB family nuclease